MSMVLIEEPESFISPRSQEALVNYLSKMSDEKKLWILISTHSEHVLENIPPEHINVLDPSNPTASIQKVKGQDRYLQVLGLAPRKRGALLFEDSCGTALAKLIYSHFGSSIPKTYDFVCLGGDTNVVSVLERLKSDGFTLRLAGVLDGDKRAQANTSRCKWPVLFLPGGDPPDQALYECARDSVTSFSEKIGKPEEDVTQMIAQVEGLDHHDAIIELARTLDVTYEQMLFALFLVWIADENNARLANQFLTDTNQALKE